jgi:hypothetical protein
VGFKSTVPAAIEIGLVRGDLVDLPTLFIKYIVATLLSVQSTILAADCLSAGIRIAEENDYVRWSTPSP